MTRKKSGEKKDEDYRAVGYAFLAISLVMFIPESTRAVAIAFFAIGIAFVVMKGGKNSSERNSSNKKK